MNASFDGRPITLHLESNHIVLIDPLALDGLSGELEAIGAAERDEQLARLAALSRHGLRIGVHSTDAAPGTYEIGLDAFEPSGPNELHPGTFDVESGAVVLIDLAALSAVARAFSWERYDTMLQSPVGDDSLLEELNNEVGGPRFAIFSADSGSPFTGDGSFRLRAGIPSASSRAAEQSR